MQRLNALKTRNPALKTLVSLGGWEMGSMKFHKMVESHANMNKFAQNSIAFLRTHNFDGLDMDWEYPAARGSPVTDKHAFSELLMVLHNAFAAEGQRSHKNRLLLTAAVAPSSYRTEQSYDVRMISRMAARNSTAMLSVLKKVSLDEFAGNFDKQKVSPDIVCFLSTQELRQIGLSRKEAMIKLRVKCIKYGAN
ncbi:hypothetical protein CHS0354_028963 [Potamilus streckersoni]|uniref:GH18 domain-containing protein n=1 Tax=Potamilus streckersoni TaxID=2493646 RepID=A0AAE0SAR8_9BIVA|nr:hypothetical protein CHS0354_028963 [Potamilus streckersoni]